MKASRKWKRGVGGSKHLAILVLGLTGLLAAALVALSCEDEPAVPARMEAFVGDTIAIGDVTLQVTALAGTSHPSLPDVVLRAEEPLPLHSGESFYQVRVRIRNGGSRVARVNPRDFSLAASATTLTLDASRSGPPARSLLHGTSLELLLTFRGPAGLTPDLSYAPQWSSKIVIVKGSRKPAGMASLPSSVDAERARPPAGSSPSAVCIIYLAKALTSQTLTRRSTTAARAPRSFRRSRSARSQAVTLLPAARRST